MADLTSEEKTLLRTETTDILRIRELHQEMEKIRTRMEEIQRELYRLNGR